MTVWTRVLGTAAAGAVAAGTLTACGGGDQVPSIGYLIDSPITTYNGNTASGAFSGAAQALPRVLTGMSYPGPFGESIADSDFGSASEVPGTEADIQTIQYRLNAAAVWSDGVPTSCDDLVLAWVARSGRFSTTDDEGRPVPLFDAGNPAGYADIDRVECQSGSKDATVVFRPGRKYTDWKALFGATEVLPAHIATQAAEVSNIGALVQSGDVEALGKVAEFWNTRWQLVPGEIDTALLPSSGPYKIESLREDGGLVLVENEKWWGIKPATSRIVVYGKGTDVVDKMESGSVDVVDIGAKSVSELDLEGFSAANMPARGIEQLVFATGGVFGNVDVRRAFALCVPRQRLFDEVGHPDYTNETGLGAGVLNSRLVTADSLLYGPAAGGDSAKYLVGDIPAAQAALTAAGVNAPTIRIGYAAPDERRAQTVRLIADSCRQAGITVEDSSSPGFTPLALRDGQVDAVLGGTGAVSGPAGSASNVAPVGALLAGSGTNYGRFDNPRFEDIADRLLTDGSSTAQLNLSVEGENLLWSEMPTLPLFDTPRTIAFSDGLDGGIANPTVGGAGWNMDRWVLRE